MKFDEIRFRCKPTSHLSSLSVAQPPSAHGAAMIDPSAEQVRFGSFVLDLARGELLHGARQVPLRRQAFDTLRYLIEHSGRIVSKIELVRSVWASPPADPDGSVVQCIKEIRKALGAEGRWMIRTVAGAGYEFKAEVITLRPEAGTQQVDSEASGSRRAVLMDWIARRPALASGGYRLLERRAGAAVRL
jgi:DNA-binding winged helix-turn-helix (wHTH) protein